EIEELRRQGLSVTRISDLLGIDRKTVRKYLQNPQTPRYGPRVGKKRGSLLTSFEPFIKERLKAGVWNGRVLYRELAQQGYEGKYTIVSDYLRPLRKEAMSAAVRRFETPPGHQAQVDWGELGDITLLDGQKLLLQGFVMTLGHSRAMFFDIATDQTVETLLAMHERAFEALGGIPKQVLYDNMKTVVLGSDARGETVWNSAFLDFARYWGFEPRLCRPYRPQTKGKVESGIGYVRKNFLCGRTASDLEDLRRQAAAWCAQVANVRIHGTTHRLVSQAWAEEKPHLQPLVSGKDAFVYSSQEVRHVTADAFVHFGSSRYSVPWRLAGKEVLVNSRLGRLEIWREGSRIAVHELAQSKHQVVVATDHHEGIPFGGGIRKGKPRLHLVEGGPDVEVRSLLEYEALAGGMR
ncbi:MAG: IS21 family transposase, partial [Chthoniobacter sp.]|nr:IS21 family transposase [Chthoniobacter sp.]